MRKTSSLHYWQQPRRARFQMGRLRGLGPVRNSRQSLIRLLKHRRRTESLVRSDCIGGGASQARGGGVGGLCGGRPAGGGGGWGWDGGAGGGAAEGMRGAVSCST